MLGHDAHNPETYDTNGEDHCADAICYMCLSRPFASVKVNPPKKHDRYRREEKPSVWTV